MENNDSTGPISSASNPNASSSTASNSTSSTERPSSISDALKLIDDVINRDGANLRELVTSEYENLRRAIDNFAPNVGEQVNKYGTQAVDALSGYAAQGLDQGKKIASQVDSQVRANPWAIIGGVALGSLAIGFMLGKGNSDAEAPELH